MDPRLSSMSENNGYDNSGTSSFRGKFMFGAIVVMFIGILVIMCIHLYARCYLLRSRRRNHLRNRRNQLVFYIDPTTSTPTPRGLESAVLNSLPVFVYSPEKHAHLPECAVCLSEFEENEKGRLLPKCNHGFHIDCIDMWFHSNSTCPLCRSLVELELNEPGPSEGRKELAIEIPNRGFMENELGGGQSSPAVSQGFISPVTRFLNFTSMLNMNRRSGGTTPSGIGTSSDETSVPDIEKASCPNTQMTPAADFHT